MVTWNGRHGDLGNLNYKTVAVAYNGKGAITKPNMPQGIETTQFKKWHLMAEVP